MTSCGHLRKFATCPAHVTNPTPEQHVKLQESVRTQFGVADASLAKATAALTIQQNFVPALLAAAPINLWCMPLDQSNPVQSASLCLQCSHLQAAQKFAQSVGYLFYLALTGIQSSTAPCSCANSLRLVSGLIRLHLATELARIPSGMSLIRNLKSLSANSLLVIHVHMFITHVHVHNFGI